MKHLLPCLILASAPIVEYPEHEGPVGRYQVVPSQITWDARGVQTYSALKVDTITGQSWVLLCLMSNVPQAGWLRIIDLPVK